MSNDKKDSKNPKKPASKSRSRSTWLADLQRRRNVRAVAKRFLIVCEDDKSAPNYFNALKKQFNLSATSVMVVGSGGHSQPIQVVDRAIDVKEKANDDDSGTLPFNEVWCVIDGEFGAEINNARFRANANNVKLAISTMCFEYWILLHFEDNDTSTLDCDALVSTLKKKHIAKYAKGSCDFHDVVQHVRVACRRAETLRRPGIRRHENPEVQNPCSEVYKLINAILPPAPSGSA